MRYRTFPRTGWTISEIGYGLWGMGGWTGSNDDESAAALDRAIELGCTFFDTAWVYGLGRSERLLGAALRETSEEVGIDVMQGGRVLGRLPTVRPMSTRLPPIAVTPYVALAPPGAAPRLRAGEVEAAFWMSLEQLSGAGACAVVRREIRDEVREWPAYPSPWGPIWGITERIVSGFIELAELAR